MSKPAAAPVAPAPHAAGLILSGTYVINSLVAEFGLLPPAFLPVANRRLYQLQVGELAPHVNQIFMTLPDDFEPERFDDEWLAINNIDVIQTPKGLSLGGAICTALKALPPEARDIWIYYGDSLISGLDKLAPEGAVVGEAEDYNRWGYCEQKADGTLAFHEQYNSDGGDQRLVLAGCYRFRRSELQECLSLANENFFAALNLYAARNKLALCEVETGRGSNWHDFGHLQPYFRSRRNFTAERQFNLLRITGRQVTKFSTQADKMRAEIEWYQAVPPALKVFLPAFLGSAQHETRTDVAGYSLEYIYLTPLNDLFVFGRLPQRIWQQALNGCREFLDVCGRSAGDLSLTGSCHDLYTAKTARRLDEFSDQRRISLDVGWTYNGRKAPSIRQMFDEVAGLVPPVRPQDIRISHGDFHFANIFFDSRSFGIKTVDPRGYTDAGRGIYGDSRYDIAKLAHSVYGLYDFIMSDILRAQVRIGHTIDFHLPASYAVDVVQEVFDDFAVNGHKARSVEIQAIVILLFLSMLPLHTENENRQKTLLANAYRLYFYLEDMKG